MKKIWEILVLGLLWCNVSNIYEKENFITFVDEGSGCLAIDKVKNLDKRNKKCFFNRDIIYYFYFLLN